MYKACSLHAQAVQVPHRPCLPAAASEAGSLSARSSSGLTRLQLFSVPQTCAPPPRPWSRHWLVGPREQMTAVGQQSAPCSSPGCSLAEAQ